MNANNCFGETHSHTLLAASLASKAVLIVCFLPIPQKHVRNYRRTINYNMFTWSWSPLPSCLESRKVTKCAGGTFHPANLIIHGPLMDGMRSWSDDDCRPQMEHHDLPLLNINIGAVDNLLKCVAPPHSFIIGAHMFGALSYSSGRDLHRSRGRSLVLQLLLPLGFTSAVSH